MNRVGPLRLRAGTAQQTRPMRIIDKPIVLRMSTRNKSVHGDQPQASTYSCTRSNKPSPKTSAPRRIVVLAICCTGVPR